MKTTTQDTKPQEQEPSKNPVKAHWICIIIVIILLAIIGYLIWMWVSLSSQNTTLTNDKKQAQSKVDDLTKQLADAKKSSTSSQIAPATTCSDTASASLKENIHDAISSKNTAALQGYMASSVTVVIAASEKGGAESAALAVADLDYLSSATSPWDFNQSASTLASWKAHFYSQYFSATAYVGKAASDQVVSFDFDCNGKIDQI